MIRANLLSEIMYIYKKKKPIVIKRYLHVTQNLKRGNI